MRVYDGDVQVTFKSDDSPLTLADRRSHAVIEDALRVTRSSDIRKDAARPAPTMEWDTAAGQAIAEAAGRTLVEYRTGTRMRYNKAQLRNDWFLVR